MTVALEWKIQIGTTADPINFTDRCEGIIIQQRCDVSRILTHSASVTLNNDDGALTPNAGGTYQSEDWFAHAVFISVSVNGNPNVPVFHGLLDTFDLFDDGTSSTVTITAVDAITVAGRSKQVSVISRTSNQRLAFASELIALTSDPGETRLPALGQLFTDAFFINDGGIGRSVSYSWSNQYAADFVFNQLGTSDLLVAWATRITGTGAVNYATYEYVLIGSELTRTGATAHTFAFTETAGSTTDIPVRSIETRFNIERLVNDATMTIVGGTAQRFTDQTSTELYGQRSIEYSQLVSATDADALALATNIVNRQSNIVFAPFQIALDAATFAGNPDALEDEIELLLDVRYGIWQTCTLEYTPTGAASQQTAELVLTGRTITAVPGRTSLVLDVLPAADYQSLVLDSSTLGVLDQNRLG